MLRTARRIFRWFAPWPRFCGLLAALFLARAAFVLSILPPFEGWDEYQHLAYIAFLAETGRAPMLGDGREVPRSLYPELVRYPHGEPAMEQVGPIGARSYKTFWTAPTPPTVLPDAPGIFLYQAQHAPMYYRLVTPIYTRLAREGGVLGAVTALRWVNVLFGAGALLVALVSVGRLVGEGPHRYLLALLIALQPLFLLNCARVANDALAVFLGTTAIAALLVLRPRRFWVGIVVGGVALGLAILAKASCLSLLPFAVFVCVLPAGRRRITPERDILHTPGFLPYREDSSVTCVGPPGSPGQARSRRHSSDAARVESQARGLCRREFQHGLLGCGLLLIIVLIIAGPYFQGNLSHYGVLTPMQETVQNRNAGKTLADAFRAAWDIDWWSDFVSRQFRHSVWVGGWSWLPAPRILRYSHEIAIYLAMLGGLLALRRRRREQHRLFTELFVVPGLLALLACTAAGLAYHAVQTKMAHGAVLTNPWYAVVAFPWLLCLGYQGFAFFPGRRAAYVLGWAVAVLYLTAELYGTFAVMTPAYAQAPWGSLARERLAQLHLPGLGPTATISAMGCVLLMVVIAVGVWGAMVRNDAKGGQAATAS